MPVGSRIASEIRTTAGKSISSDGILEEVESILRGVFVEAIAVDAPAEVEAGGITIMVLVDALTGIIGLPEILLGVAILCLVRALE
ncbi:MAG: hypothetical protein ACRDRT_13360, partial [Pseudonocardiaceae bacterium]